VAIFALDQVDLPVPLPFFDLLFTLQCRASSLVRFEPNEPVDPVSLGEAGHDLVLVLPNPPHKIDVVPV
jgi:hypothetical protein